MASNIERQMAIKAALVVTTNTPGWQYFKQLAANVVEDHLQKGLSLLDSEPAKATLLLQKAKAMQDGFSDFFAGIEANKQYEPEAAEPDWFANLSFDSQVAASN